MPLDPSDDNIHDIETVAPEDALASVLAVQPISYWWDEGFGDNVPGLTPVKQFSYLPADGVADRPDAVNFDENNSPIGINEGRISVDHAGAIKALYNWTQTMGDAPEVSTPYTAFSGPWSGTQSQTLRLVKKDKLVTLSFDEIKKAISGLTSSANVLASAAIPSGYRPKYKFWAPWTFFIGTTGSALGIMKIDTNGDLTFYTIPSSLISLYTGILGTTVVGVNAGCVSWEIA